MSFPRYPEYKDSGVKWLGQVPVHWGIRPLKYVATYNDEVMPEGTPNDYPIKYVEISDVDEQLGITGWTEYPFASAPSRARRVLKDGDVLISTVRTYLRAIAPVTEPPDGLVGSTGFAVIRPVPYIYHSALLGYVIRAEWFISSIISRSAGVSYPAINASDLVALSLPVPPWKDQQTIATFLDHETAKIDTLIHEQKRLIELLKEKRQAVISHAVTKGLDRDVPMKDSGVEWLGKVPAHWTSCRVRDVVSRIVDGPHFSPSYQAEGYMFISARNIKVDRWSLDDAKYVSEEDFLEFNKRVKPERGDVLLTKGGTTGIARAVDLNFPFQVWVHVAVLKTIQNKVDCYYLAYALNSKAGYTQSQLFTRGATNNDLGLSRIANIWFALPPIDEQVDLVAKLNEYCGKLDRLGAKAESSMALLRERRSALISAAVTGKIDVRNWQPPVDESAFDEEVRRAGMEAEA